MPAVPTVPTVPAVPTVLTVPAVPTVLTVPAVPTVPTVPAVPTVPTSAILRLSGRITRNMTNTIMIRDNCSCTCRFFVFCHPNRNCTLAHAVKHHFKHDGARILRTYTVSTYVRAYEPTYVRTYVRTYVGLLGAGVLMPALYVTDGLPSHFAENLRWVQGEKTHCRLAGSLGDPNLPDLKR